MKMNNLITRTLSGAVLVAVMVTLILFSVHTLLALALALAGASMEEFFRLSAPAGTADKKGIRNLYPILIGWVMIVTTYQVVWYGVSLRWFLVLLPLVFLLFILELYRKNSLPMQRIGTELMSLVYIALPMALLLALGISEGESGEPLYNGWRVLFYVVLIWVNDVGAYLVGMTWGKHRLFERHSPKKSWEGFLGGLLCTGVVACLLGPRMTGAINTELWVWIIFGVILTLSAVAGDLVESMLKRQANIKDSGHLIPGHGGVLDRFDAMFISLPFIYVWWQFFG